MGRKRWFDLEIQEVDKKAESLTADLASGGLVDSLASACETTPVSLHTKCVVGQGKRKVERNQTSQAKPGPRNGQQRCSTSEQSRQHAEQKQNT